MNNIVINLNFNKTISTLSGNTFGKNTYESQVKPKLNTNSSIEFVFPDNIQDIGISFVQGFFNDLVKEIGFDGIEKQVTIKADGIENAQDYVFEKLYC